MCDLRRDDGWGWSYELIREICTEESTTTIINIAWPGTMAAGRLSWCGNKQGFFPVSNFFYLSMLIA